jgi:hypothetical protein
MLALALVAAAIAAPTGPVAPVIETPAAPDAYRDLAASRGGEGAAAELACRALVEDELLLCFRVSEGGRSRYVNAADLSAWGLDLEGLEAAAAAALSENPWSPQEIEGGGRWWLAQAPEGQEAIVLLRPDWLSALGPAPVVCAPAVGVVMGWSAGDEELDTIVAVGARRAFETRPRPISPLCLRWTGAGWEPWGEARPGGN